MAIAIDEPACGQVRVANELQKRGLSVSAAGARCVWQRHDLETLPWSRRQLYLSQHRCNNGRLCCTIDHGCRLQQNYPQVAVVMDGCDTGYRDCRARWRPHPTARRSAQSLN